MTIDGTTDVTIGLLHPGEMGAAVGQCLAAAGHQVLWTDQGRSPATRERAEAAGLPAYAAECRRVRGMSVGTAREANLWDF